MRGNGPTELDVYAMYAEELTRCNSSAGLVPDFYQTKQSGCNPSVSEQKLYIIEHTLSVSIISKYVNI